MPALTLLRPLRLPRLNGPARGGLAGLAGAATAAAAQFAVVVLVTREAGQEAAGAFFAATALCLMAAGILRMDAGNGLIYFIARSRPFGYRCTSGYVRAALVPVVALSLVTATAALLSTPDPTVRVLAAALPVVVCADIVVAATRGFGAMRPTVLLGGVLQPVAQLVLVSAVVVAGAGSVPLLAAAWALPSLPVLLLSAIWLRRRLPYTPYLPGTAHDLWRYTWPRSMAAGIQAVFQRLDIVVVAMLAGPVEAAVYTAATRFKIVGQLVNQGLTQAVQPRLVRALTAGDLARARELYQSTTMWLVLLTWPIWLGYAVLAPWLLGLFGDGYASGVPVALVLAATMMLATACGMADVVLASAGHTGAGLANLVAAITVTVALDALLVPVWGAYGAALGWAGGMLVKNLLPLWRIHRRYGLRPFGAHSLAALKSWRAR
ncbi:lipopolysaccharide biosynthesis protein [Streptosporangium roseum]|uniref:Polysaccharide biosynthesis protein n=1 Tax=Streptosporangium roseum (strain ATCC 12428 / DSM 43021 / JCM 3005 / KCTC 9067 / NCIMB 10171 / NRRL 2505 / NI 9100) TaxID=479432 RepID=D2B402_STRRD|nr:polysaccharide biosynthesis C-terminal domain-containing protein [Streptosporangium roseum]ACZ91236.1 polysaccharide biosynthesis protein [Streptosporangium roseum DSM 43021]